MPLFILVFQPTLVVAFMPGVPCGAKERVKALFCLQLVPTQYAEFYRSSREINVSELKFNVFLQILFWTSMTELERI